MSLRSVMIVLAVIAALGRSAAGSELHIVNVDGNHGFIDASGAMVISPTYYKAEDFEDGLAVVETLDKGYGFIDRTGTVVIGPGFREALSFSEGLAAVATDKGWGFVDKTGTFVIPPKLPGMPDSFSDGLARVSEGQKTGYINKQGKFVIAPRFQAASRFSSGLAAVLFGDRWGYIDKTGKQAFASTFLYAEPFSEGLAAVEIRSGSYGYIDTNGAVAIKPKYRVAGSFAGGLAPVRAKSGVQFIDRSGKVVIKSRAAWATPFRHGLARVGGDIQGGSWSYIDRKGKLIWSPLDYTFSTTASEVIAPPKFDPKSKYPLLIVLPYTGGLADGFIGRYLPRGEDRSSQLGSMLAGYWPVPKEGNARAFFVLVPPGRGEASPQGFRALVAQYEARLRADLPRVLEQYPIDPSNVVVAGFSLGGDLSWGLTMRNPTLFAGAIVMGSRCSYPTKGALDALQAAKTRVYLGMGDHETRVRLRGAERARQALDRAQIENTYYTIPNAGHEMVGRDEFKRALEFTMFR